MIKTIDKTNGKRPNEDEKFYLTVEFRNGSAGLVRLLVERK